MSSPSTPIPELRLRAFEILSRELGILDTVRLFNQFHLGSGNYTEERRAMFENLTSEGITEGIRRLRESQMSPPTTSKVDA